MVRPYRRTVSFQNPKPNPNPTSKSKSKHVRSISLPCGRTHPLLPQLRDQLTSLRTWAISGRVVDGLTRLRSVLDSFDDVLQLPQTLDSLSSQINVVETLLDDFLRLVDVYEVFHGSMLGLKQELSSAQIGVRRLDYTDLGLYVKAHKIFVRRFVKFISNVESILDHDHLRPPAQQGDVDELGGVIRDIIQIVVLVSKTVFESISGSFGPGRKPIWAGLGVKKKENNNVIGAVEEFVEVVRGVENLMKLIKRDKKKGRQNNFHGFNTSNENVEEAKRGVLKRMEEMEECVGEIERECERVFRSLITTRVSLLNILTHA
ncbi:hypothetical protein vseg_017886 [Gypsophila vaccaria]